MRVFQESLLGWAAVRHSFVDGASTFPNPISAPFHETTASSLENGWSSATFGVAQLKAQVWLVRLQAMALFSCFLPVEMVVDQKGVIAEIPQMRRKGIETT